METRSTTISPTRSAPAKPVLQVTDVVKSFGTKRVLDHFSCSLGKGENLAILGKSGSGKSVLIKCIIGLLEPDEGAIQVLDVSVPDLGAEALDRLRARVGFLFQSNALYDSMSVRENLEFPLRRHWLRDAQQDVDALVREVLTNVGLAHTIDMMPAELSGGMRKRIALARTLILRPEIMLYDEPTTGLDPVTAREISELMIAIRETYSTSSVIISHDMKCIERTADRIVLLIDGKNYAEGSYKELSASTDPRIRQFFE